MSKQQTLAWTSLATSLSVVVCYVIIMFGWPGMLPDYSGQVFQIFFNVFWIAVVIEIILEISDNKKAVDKDERDFMIEAHGLKNAYGFLSFAVVVVLVQMFLGSIFANMSESHTMVAGTVDTFHILFIVLFVSNIIKRTTQIYYYNKAE